MKIVIASTIVPFINGGGNFIVDWLAQKLREYGHQVEVIRIPFSSYYKDMLQQMTALRLYHIEDICERLICIRMPAYLLRHPSKYLWFIHHYREMYDLWNTQLDSIPKDAESFAIRELIMRADNKAFSEAKKIFTNSQIVSNRLMKYNRIDSKPIYPPLLNPSIFHCEGYGDYIYYASRIGATKRQLLAVEAMRYTNTNVKLLITGRGDELSYPHVIQQVISDNGLEDRVVLRDEWISEEEKSKYFAECLCGLYIPFDEDSYGYPSLEAHHSRKAVITCSDSGGTDELIVDGENGFIVEPDPKALAQAFDRMYLDKKMAERMGERGLERIDELHINWDTVIERLTEG